MRKLFILSILISLINLSVAQTAPFTKKDWKKFNTSFTENLNAAQQFYNGNIDYENKNQFNFMPTSKVVLHNTSSNSIDDMGYISYNSYDFTTKEEALAFYNALKQNLELPKNYSTTEEGANLWYITAKLEQGMHSSAQIEFYDTTVSVKFTPPLDVNIPLNIK